MADKSMYEQGHPARQAQNNAICFGRVHSVDPEKRMCAVKTFFATHPSVNDQFIENCQWLNMDANPDGDESTSIPRRGSMGMVIFVQGEPFIFGYFKGINKKGQAVTGKEKAKLTEGDKIFSTKAGNYVLIKANGSIEIKSKETLRTLYFPTKSLLQHLVRNYEMKADGGIIDWKSDKTGNTKYSATFRKDLLNTFQVLEERGSVGGATIYRTSIGPGVGGAALSVYKHEVDTTGETRVTVGPPGIEAFKATITPDGKASIQTIGDVDVTTSLGNVSAKALVGNMALEGSLGKLLLGKGMVGLGGPTAELLDLFDQLLDLLKDAYTSEALEVHVGNLGYPTAPPTNAADYLKAVALIVKIKLLLATIKGGV